MTLLVRHDGIKFILRAYRERLILTKRSLLVQRIRLLAEQHGEYAHLFPSAAEQALEIAFAQQQGYLLGEIIWDYFGKPRYLIFCEPHQEDPSQVIVIVVRDGSIYLDAIIDRDELAAELLPLLTSQQPFRIIAVDDVPISEEPKDAHFTLPKSLIASYETLEKPLIPELPTPVEYVLQPLPKILTSKLLGRHMPWPIVIPAIALVALLLVWWFYPTPPEEPLTHTTATAIPQNPYADFYQGLSTPTPQSVVNELVGMISTIQLLPGWQATTFDFTNNQYQIALVHESGDVDWLTEWAKYNDFPVNLTTGGATIQLPSKLHGRAKPRQIFVIQQVISLIDDKLAQILGDTGFTVGQMESHANAKRVMITLNMDGVSPSILALIGQILGDDLPITIDKIDLSQPQNNLLSGTIQLSVWGK